MIQQLFIRIFSSTRQKYDRALNLMVLSNLNGLQPDDHILYDIEQAKVISNWFSIITIGFSILILIGWRFQLFQLTYLWFGSVSVKANAAICFLLLSFAALSGDYYKSSIGTVCAVAGLITASLTLMQSVLNTNLGIDQVIVADTLQFTHPGRMAPTTALIFILLFSSLLLRNVRVKGVYVAEWLALAGCFTSYLFVVGYAFGIRSITDLTFFSIDDDKIAYCSACMLIMQSAMIIFVEPKYYLFKEFLKNSRGAFILRLFAATVFLLTAAGGATVCFLRLLGLNENAAAMFVISTITVVLFFSVACICRLLDQTDQVRVSETQQREDLLFSVAHNLKVPIVGSERVLSLLVDGFGGELSPQHKEIINMLKQSNEEMLWIIQNLVYEFRRGVEKMQSETFDFNAMLLTVIEDIKPLANQKGLPIQVDFTSITSSIEGDRQALRVLTENLLQNAIKYTKTGQIDVRTSTFDNHFKLSVSDTGIGISDEQQTQLFKRTLNSERVANYSSTSGLGLYLCRLVAEAHAGSLVCESAPGSGSTFTLTLPLKPSLQTKPNSPSGAKEPKPQDLSLTLCI